MPARTVPCVVGAEDADRLSAAVYGRRAARPDPTAPACRPLVAGLLAVLDDPDLGVVAGTPRHAWTDLVMLASVPIGVPLEVGATLVRTAALGTGTGLWIDVDVSGPGGAVLRSEHVVTATSHAPPGPRSSLPRPARTGLQGPRDLTDLVIDSARLDAYRTGASDTSTVHTSVLGPAIVPGLLLLLASVARLPRVPDHPLRVTGRFSRPLPVGAAAVVRSSSRPDGDAQFTVEAEGRPVLRDGVVRPLTPGRPTAATTGG